MPARIERRSDGPRHCPACGSIRVKSIENEYGVDYKCERCGYKWHCPKESETS